MTGPETGAGAVARDNRSAAYGTSIAMMPLTLMSSATAAIVVALAERRPIQAIRQNASNAQVVRAMNSTSDSERTPAVIHVRH